MPARPHPARLRGPAFRPRRRKPYLRAAAQMFLQPPTTRDGGLPRKSRPRPHGRPGGGGGGDAAPPHRPDHEARLRRSRDPPPPPPRPPRRVSPGAGTSPRAGFARCARLGAGRQLLLFALTLVVAVDF